MILVTGGKYQGKTVFAESISGGRQVLAPYEDLILERLESGLNILETVKEDLKRDPDCIIVLSEIGCGVTPVEERERRLLDAAGAAGCYLAAQALEVYRVTAGLPLRLK